MFSISNKNILITGASKGIGYGLAKILAKEGANVIATSRDVDADYSDAIRTLIPITSGQHSEIIRTAFQ